MGIYRLLWLQAVTLAAVCGATAAIFVLPLDAVVALAISGALTVVLLAGVARAYARGQRPQKRRCAAAASMKAAITAGVFAGVGCIAAAGLMALSPGSTLLLIVLLGGCAPAALRRQALQALLRTLGAHQGRGTPADTPLNQARTAELPGESPNRSTRKSARTSGGVMAPRSPGAPARSVSSLPNPAECALLADLQLCWWWRASFVKLQGATSPAQRMIVIETRRALLDELADRDPDSFARWLASGARAASDPARFFITRRRPVT